MHAIIAGESFDLNNFNIHHDNAKRVEGFKQFFPT